MIAEVRTRLRALVQRRATDADLDEEIRYHVEREVERNIAKGMSANDARDAARRAFGATNRSWRTPSSMTPTKIRASAFR